MSDGISTHNHRITKPDFRPCSTCQSHSQAPFYLYALRTISSRAEGTFGRLRYSLGGDRPSQTAHQTLSFAMIEWRKLETQFNKGGISRLTPPKPELRIQSLPPILRMLNQISMPSYSKGPRGLSVLLLVTGIFTGHTISPSLSLRHRTDRWTIHAGRNLPDKEFRYLRTVIVTAAVYRGLDSTRRLAANTSS